MKPFNLEEKFTETEVTCSAQELFEYGQLAGRQSKKIAELEEKIKEFKEIKEKEDLKADEYKTNEMKMRVHLVIFDKFTKLNFIKNFPYEHKAYTSLSEEEKKKIAKDFNFEIKETEHPVYHPFVPLDSMELNYTQVKELVKFLNGYINDVDKEYETIQKETDK